MNLIFVNKTRNKIHLNSLIDNLFQCLKLDNIFKKWFVVGNIWNELYFERIKKNKIAK